MVAACTGGGRKTPEPRCERRAFGSDLSCVLKYGEASRSREVESPLIQGPPLAAGAMKKPGSVSNDGRRWSEAVYAEGAYAGLSSSAVAPRVGDAIDSTVAGTFCSLA